MDNLLRQIAPWRTELAAHPLYGHLRSLQDVRTFMSYHVYAVWDFMALLKALQRHVTCVWSQWTPVGSARIRRLINEMILEEESDEIDGVATSHFELYRQAMIEAGADPAPIDRFLAGIDASMNVPARLGVCNAPAGVQAFVGTTFQTIATERPHAIAAAFALGRETAIPAMFGQIVHSACRSTNSLKLFELYLNRHIELDGDAHGAMAIAMLENLCGDDPRKWEESADNAIMALKARIALWDTVDDALSSRWPEDRASDDRMEERAM